MKCTNVQRIKKIKSQKLNEQVFTGSYACLTKYFLNVYNIVFVDYILLTLKYNHYSLGMKQFIRLTIMIFFLTTYNILLYKYSHFGTNFQFLVLA